MPGTRRYAGAMSKTKTLPQDGGSASRPGLLHRWFLEHPRTVGEDYWEHAGIASRFGGRMIAGGVRCLVHAVLPAMCKTAASDCVAGLNGELQSRRRAAADSYPDYVI